jgi:hypothetical protein
MVLAALGPSSNFSRVPNSLGCPPDRENPTMAKDLFTCHASEDKDDVARPLTEVLTQIRSTA